MSRARPCWSISSVAMPLRGRCEHETVEAWRIRADADLNRMRSLIGPQLGAEIIRRGFADLPADGERTRIGLSNSLCPDAPPVVGENDIEVVAQYSRLLVPALETLEDAGLLSSESRGRSSLRFYSLTARGRSALENDDIEAILASRPSSQPST